MEEGGEELDLILWEDIKGGEEARMFSWTGDGAISGTVSRGVQTDPMLDTGTDGIS